MAIALIGPVTVTPRHVVVGGSLLISWETRTTADALVDQATNTCAVFDPEGNSTSLTVTKASTGKYSAPYTTV